MKEDQLEPQTASLLGLYLEQKEDLLSRIDTQRPARAAEQVSSFIRDMERAYTDSSTAREQAHLVHHVLNAVAAASQTLVTVEGTASVSSASDRSSGSGTGTSSTNFVSSARSTPIFFLWGVTVACILAVILILTNDPEPAIVPIVSLIVIALLATVGATTSGSGKAPALTLPMHRWRHRRGRPAAHRGSRPEPAGAPSGRALSGRGAGEYRPSAAAGGPRPPA